MYQLYGIPNCDTVKKARKHLEADGVEYGFIDFKKTPPTKELLQRWKLELGELPVNKRGTTYRKVKDDYEESSEAKKVLLLIELSSMIKRPLLEKNNIPVVMGYKKEDYAKFN